MIVYYTEWLNYMFAFAYIFYREVWILHKAHFTIHFNDPRACMYIYESIWDWNRNMDKSSQTNWNELNWQVSVLSINLFFSLILLKRPSICPFILLFQTSQPDHKNRSLIQFLISLCHQWPLTICFAQMFSEVNQPLSENSLFPKPAEWLCTMCTESASVTWNQAEKQT